MGISYFPLKLPFVKYLFDLFVTVSRAAVMGATIMLQASVDHIDFDEQQVSIHLPDQTVWTATRCFLPYEKLTTQDTASCTYDHALFRPRFTCLFFLDCKRSNSFLEVNEWRQIKRNQSIRILSYRLNVPWILPISSFNGIANILII